MTRRPGPYDMTSCQFLPLPHIGVSAQPIAVDCSGGPHASPVAQHSEMRGSHDRASRVAAQPRLAPLVWWCCCKIQHLIRWSDSLCRTRCSANRGAIGTPRPAKELACTCATIFRACPPRCCACACDGAAALCALRVHAHIMLSGSDTIALN